MLNLGNFDVDFLHDLYGVFFKMLRFYDFESSDDIAIFYEFMNILAFRLNVYEGLVDIVDYEDWVEFQMIPQDLIHEKVKVGDEK